MSKAMLISRFVMNILLKVSQTGGVFTKTHKNVVCLSDKFDKEKCICRSAKNQQG
jgi:hypothetical protein